MSLDAQTIAELVQLPLRKVRYVLDQRLLPGMRARKNRTAAGQPREFTGLSACFVGWAALLLEGGVQRRAVVHLLDRLTDLPWPPPGVTVAGNPRPPGRLRLVLAQQLYASRGAAEVRLGDGANLRLVLAEFDTFWREPSRGVALDSAYRPRVEIRMDFAWVRDAVRAAARE